MADRDGLPEGEEQQEEEEQEEVVREEEVRQEQIQQPAVRMMAYGVHPPEFLDLSSKKLPEDFADFRQAWEIYVIAAEIEEKSDATKVALLKNFLGTESVKVLNTLLAPAAQNTPAAILTALQGYCVPQTNETYERYIFNTAVQAEGEDINKFVTRLRTLAESCNYGQLKDSLIRDQIVVGIRSDETRKALLKTANLTLVSAIDTCRAQKLVENRMAAMSIKEEPRDPEPSAEVIAKVDKGARKKFESFGEACKYCGRRDHKLGDRENCPANGVTCRKCGKQNHYARVCKVRSENEYQNAGGSREASNSKQKSAKKVKLIDEDCEDSDDAEYITSIEVVNVVEKKITVSVGFAMSKGDAPKKICCQVDTGASCNVIAKEHLEKLMGKVKLEPSTTELRGFGGHLVPAIGKVILRHESGGKRYKVAFEVVDLKPGVLKIPLLGKNTCIALGIVIIQDVKLCEIESKQGNNKTVKNPKAEKIVKKYEEVYIGDGKLAGKVNIELEQCASKQQEPRRVPVAVRDRLKCELDDLERRGIIAKIEEPTDWASNIVIVKRNEKLRICLDPVYLNRAIKRPRFQMATVEEILPELHDAKVFSTLDIQNGFWHVELTEESSKVTAFWTPFGRYVWKRLPFGLSCSPEIFQAKLQQALHGLKGIEVLVDDILCVGRGATNEEAVADHNKNLEALLERCRNKGIKLNRSKSKLNQTEVCFFGHVLSRDGLKPDPSKTAAIREMPEPKDATELQRFLGLATYMAKFIPKLSELSRPLREVLIAEEWHWGKQQAKAFGVLKQQIADITVLKYYNPKRSATIQCDASSFALGAVLLQEGQPVMFASRTLTPTERRYAQIEKETLAILFSCKRFDQYIFGQKQVTVQSDHQPLQSIFRKPLCDVPKRIQRMILSLQRYDLEVQYVKGKDLVLADTLSRNIEIKEAPTAKDRDPLWKTIEEINALETIDIQPELLERIKQATKKDETCQILKQYIVNGWPNEKASVIECVKPFFAFRAELVIQEGVILRGNRIVVPRESRPDVLKLLHYSHQGEQATLRKARDIIYWPNLNDHVQNMVKKCDICNQYKDCQRSEPMQSAEIPEHPFQIVSMDLGELTHEGKKMIVLVSVDHFSNYLEVDFLSSQRTSELIDRCKKNFSRMGIPRKIITDSAQQFVGQEWMQFMVDYGISHVTSAPYHHESNGKAESAIKIAKNIIKKALQDKKDIWLALLDWRNTPQLDGYSPSQKAMGRKTRGILPATISQLQLQTVDTQKVRKDIELRKVKSKFYHDRKAQALPKLIRGQEVFVQLKPEKTPEWTRGRITEVLSDRDYQVTANGGSYRRNRKYLRDACSTVKLEESTLQETENRSVASPSAFYSMSEGSGHPVASTPKPADRTASHLEQSSTQSRPLQSTMKTSPAENPVGGNERPKRVVRRPIRFDDYDLGES